MRSNVHIAYLNSDIDTSRTALDGKLKNIELKTSRELVRYSAIPAEQLIREMKGCNEPMLPSFRIKFLDGNGIESTAHRIKVLPDTKAGALPGKSRVLCDPETDIAIDVIPCEDGHAQERSWLKAIVDTIERDDLMVADRNFGVWSFLFGIATETGYFAIRPHQSMPYKSLSEMTFRGCTDTGKVSEGKVKLTYDGEELEARRIIVRLTQPTRDGELEISIFSTLPKEVDAIKIAEIYRNRWGIETAFQKLEQYLNSELNTLGYPKAALFGFGTALIAFKVDAVVMAAIRASHPDINVNDDISDYSIAEAISITSSGMSILVQEEDGSIFVKGSISEVSTVLLYLAGHLNLRKFKKNKRGAKKAPKPKDKFKGNPHVSTARLLAADG